MRKLGDELEASAAGSGERADVLLLASPASNNEHTVLGWAYHTTNVPTGTASMTDGQAYPETRILWRQCVPFKGLMRTAARLLAERLQLPAPDPPDPIAQVLPYDEWRSELLPPNPETADVVEVGNSTDEDPDFGSSSNDGSSDDSESDSSSEH